MSALENLKEKLRAKPNVELDLKQVDIVIPVANKLEEVKFSKVTIRDKRETSGFNMADLTKKLKDQSSRASRFFFIMFIFIIIIMWYYYFK